MIPEKSTSFSNSDIFSIIYDFVNDRNMEDYFSNYTLKIYKALFRKDYNSQDKLTNSVYSKISELIYKIFENRQNAIPLNSRHNSRQRNNMSRFNRRNTNRRNTKRRSTKRRSTNRRASSTNI